MKKLLSILLAVLMVMSLCTVSLSSTSATTNITETVTHTVQKGDYIRYTYSLDSVDAKIAALDATVNYSENLELVPELSDPTDDTTYKTAMFPKLLGPLVVNLSVNQSIIFNYSNTSGVRFTKDNGVVVNALFKVTKDGTATISTTMEALADTELNKIVFDESVKIPSLYNPSTSLDMTVPTNADYSLSNPVISKISNTTSGPSISWSKLSGASKYRVFVKDSASLTYKALATTSSTSCTHTSAKSGTKYTYTLRALDSKGNYISGFDTVGKSITYVAAPKVTALSNTTSGVKLTWGKVAGASQYRVYVKSGSSWKTLGLTSSTSYTHTSAKSGTTYKYTVRATDSKGNNLSSYVSSGWSKKFVAAPKIKSVTNTTKGVKITWSKVSGASKYRVYIKGGSSKSWKSKTVTSSTSYTHTSAKSGTTYTYTIRATDSKGNNLSSYISAGKSIKYVAAPKAKKLSNTSKGVKITWSKVSGASKYRVYVKSGSKWKSLGVTSKTSFTHTAAKSGKTYTYTLRATNSKGTNISAYNTTGWKIKCKR